MEINIKKRYVCISNDLSDPNSYYTIYGELKIGDAYWAEYIDEDGWYIFDNIGNYKAFVRAEFLTINFVPVKGQGKVTLQEENDKFICIRDCERTAADLYYRVIPKKFSKGNIYTIKILNSTSYRYIYEENGYTFITSVEKDFVDINFISYDKEVLEVEMLFDEIFYS